MRSACNYTTEAGCVTSKEGCRWLDDYAVSVVETFELLFVRLC